MKVNVNDVEVDLKGGKTITVDETNFDNPTVKEGEQLQVFKNDDLVDFEFKEKKSEDGKTVIVKKFVGKLHTIDAQIAEKLGKGKIVK